MNEPRILFLRLRTRDKILFAKQLGILIGAGIPIMRALQIIHEQASRRPLKIIFGKIFRDVESGKPLSKSLADLEKAFGGFVVNIIRVGEVSGSLERSLDFLSEELKKKEHLRRKIAGALAYPIFIAVATLGIAILLITYVFPKVLPVFQSFKADLPASTRLLIALSAFFGHNWPYLSLGAVILAIILPLSLKREAVRVRTDKFILHLPLIGDLLRCYHTANLTRTLGLLLKSDVRIVEALNITAATSSNLAYREALTRTASALSRGGKISVSFSEFPGLFPSMVVQMISVGETTGNLSHVLLYMAATYEEDLSERTKQLSTAIEPLLMIFMGLLVGFIAVSIITPIYGITQSLHP